MLVIEYVHCGSSEIHTLAAEQEYACEKVYWAFNDGEQHCGDIDTFLKIMKNLKDKATILNIHGSIEAYQDVTYNERSVLV